VQVARNDAVLDGHKRCVGTRLSHSRHGREVRASTDDRMTDPGGSADKKTAPKSGCKRG
jgi:hypothetical protein